MSKPSRSDYGLASAIIIGAILVIASLVFAADTPNENPATVEKEPQACPKCFDVNLSCPSCQCKATCSSKTLAFESCHIPKKGLNLPEKESDYTGYSNIPSIFAGNTLITVETSELIPGCFYGFEDEGMVKVHRLLGVYPDFIEFKGDNSDGTERVKPESIRFLVKAVVFS